VTREVPCLHKLVTCILCANASSILKVGLSKLPHAGLTSEATDELPHNLPS
jgi:hypothetical protein